MKSRVVKASVGVVCEGECSAERVGRGYNCEDICRMSGYDKFLRVSAQV